MAILALQRNRKNSSPEAIAGAVERPAHLLAAETERAALEERRADIRTRVDAAHDQFWRFGSGGQNLGAVLLEENALGAAIEANRRALLSARREHAAAVGAALQPSAEAAARQFLAAHAEAEAAIEVIGTIEKLEAAAECRAEFPRLRLGVDHVVARCRDIIGGHSRGGQR